MARLLFVFLDGIGLGSSDRAANPFVDDWPGLRRVAGSDWTMDAWRPDATLGRVRSVLDASLGVAGLPQSATGQTALLTGRNGAALMGRHYGPWPGPTLRALLERAGLFHAARTVGEVALANAYPRAYLTALAPERAGTGMGPRRRVRASAPVVAATAAGSTLADLDAFRVGRAAAGDLDGSALAALLAEPDRAAAVVGAERQAAVVARLASEHAFTFLDVWSADRVGHRQDRDEARRFVDRLDRFLGTLLERLDDDVTVLVTSDHGNLEDLNSPRHTHASVPLLALGPHAARFADVDSLLGVAAAATRVLRSA